MKKHDDEGVGYIHSENRKRSKLYVENVEIEKSVLWSRYLFYGVKP